MEDFLNNVLSKSSDYGDTRDSPAFGLYGQWPRDWGLRNRDLKCGIQYITIQYRYVQLNAVFVRAIYQLRGFGQLCGHAATCHGLGPHGP